MLERRSDNDVWTEALGQRWGDARGEEEGEGEREDSEAMLMDGKSAGCGM